jgi:hypothetical protein
MPALLPEPAPQVEHLERRDFETGGRMYFLATGNFTDRSKLGPLMKEDVAKVHEHLAAGILLSAYRRADGGTGPVLIYKTENLEQAKERAAELPFVQAGLLHLDFTELVTI